MRLFTRLIFLLATLLLSQRVNTVIHELSSPANNLLPVTASVDQLQLPNKKTVETPDTLVGAQPFQYEIKTTIEEIGNLVEKSAAPLYDTSKPAIRSNQITRAPQIENSAERIIFIAFDNDIFVEKDYYFTNGAEIGIMDARLKMIFPSLIFPELNVESQNIYGMRLRQNMFTPINPETQTIVEGDRPFAGTLTLELFRISIHPNRKYSITSSLRAGVIGKASMASSLQSSLHELYPYGWKYQIANDILLNYNMELNRTFIRNHFLEMNLHSAIGLGTYQSRASIGVHFSFSPFKKYFNHRPQNGGNTPQMYGLQSLQSPIIFFGRISAHLIGYDATLSGGMFNKSSPYTIPQHLIKRLTQEAELGIAIINRNYSFGIKLVYLSPEFKGGRPHQWGSISISHML